jgi:hypothetical protein
MNKLFPILLVTILIGCSTSPLEKCADSSWLKSNVRINFEECNRFLKRKDNNMFNPAIVTPEYNECMSEKRVGSKAWKKDYPNKNLKTKLKNGYYESFYKSCESDKNRYPETFNSKWK